MDTAEFVITDEVQYGNFVAQRLDVDDNLSWGEGAIQGQQASPEQQRELATAVLSSIQEVTDETTDERRGQASYCTDGRKPVRLLDDSTPLPVRKKLVGASTVNGFYIAESLGERFYADPNAPVEARVKEVVEFLYDNGIIPSTHVGCGAGGGFTAITANVPRYAQNGLYVARNKLFLPDGVYDADLHAEMMRGNESRLQRGVYDGLSLDVFLDAVKHVRGAGEHAVSELMDDGRGVHGHMEEDIFRLRVGNRALNVVELAGRTGGRQVFDVNDDAQDDLAAIFARGNDEDYRIARMASEDFTNAGHGTLAKHLPTWRVTEAA